MLTGTLEQSLSRTLPGGKVGAVVSIDRSQFAAAYEGSVLSMDKLTAHQEKKMKECLTGDYVHLQAPAGAGKTFVALNRVLELLYEEKEARALFVARNAALCYFVIRWVCRRVRNTLQRLLMLKRLDVLFEPFSVGPQAVKLERGRIQMVSRAALDVQYSLVVVDEAHHIYKDRGMRDAVEIHVPAGCWRMLLSDISQSSGRDIVYPPGEPLVVQLTEVVRSSQRIVAGAAAFQLGENKVQVTSQHNATGPPLKSFMFDLEGDPIEAYAQHTLRALNHVMTTFGSLELHDRVAIVVSDERFAAAFRAPLADALLARFPSRPFTLVSAQEAAASALLSAGGRGKEGEWLVLDSIAAMDGLERLIAIAVGLDAVIKEGSGSSTLETRSRLYRALTRAHMMAVVVNEFLPGGWLEFLGHVSLKKGETKFNRKDEMENKMKADAVDGVTSAAKEKAEGEEKDAAQKVQKLAMKWQASSKASLGDRAAKTESKPDPAGDKSAATPAAPKAESKPAGGKPATPAPKAEKKAEAKKAAAKEAKAKPAPKLAQSVWDTSENETSKASGPPVFNPYDRKKAADSQYGELIGGLDVVEHRDSDWTRCANAIIQELKGKGVQRGQVVAIDAHNNGQSEDAIFSAHYSKALPGLGPLDELTFDEQKHAIYGWKKQYEHAARHVRDSIDRRENLVSITAAITQTTTAAITRGGNASCMYVFYYKDASVTAGAGLALEFVEERDEDYDTAANGLIGQLKGAGAQCGQIVSIDVHNNGINQPAVFSAFYCSSLPGLGPLELSFESQLHQSYGWAEYYSRSHRVIDRMPGMRRGQLVSLTGHISRARGSVWYTFYHQLGEGEASAAEPRLVEISRQDWIAGPYDDGSDAFLGPHGNSDFSGSLADVKKLLAKDYRGRAKQVVLYWDAGQEGTKAHWMQIVPGGGVRKPADDKTAVAYRIEWEEESGIESLGAPAFQYTLCTTSTERHHPRTSGSPSTSAAGLSPCSPTSSSKSQIPIREAGCSPSAGTLLAGSSSHRGTLALSASLDKQQQTAASMRILARLELTMAGGTRSPWSTMGRMSSTLTWMGSLTFKRAFVGISLQTRPSSMLERGKTSMVMPSKVSSETSLCTRECSLRLS